MLNDAKKMLEVRNSELSMILSTLPEFDVIKASIIKSSIILMGYNMMEGVFSVLLQGIFDFLLEKKLEVKNCPKNLQIAISKYHVKIINENPKNLLDFWEKENITIPEFSEYQKIIKLFSGNLDARKIKEIALNFGVQLRNFKEDKKLKFIKDTRNKLAHGEVSFTQACRDRTTEEIKNYIDSAYIFLSHTIEDFETVYLKY